MTPEYALMQARQLAHRRKTVRRYPCSRLEQAEYGSGYLFVDPPPVEREGLNGRYILITEFERKTGFLRREVPLADAVEEVIDGYLASVPPAVADLGEEQRLAVVAFDTGADAVDPAAASPAADLDYANYVLIELRLAGGEPASGHEVIKRHEKLWLPPHPGTGYSHSCPLCVRPALSHGCHSRAVCDDCATRTSDQHGDRIRAYFPVLVLPRDLNADGPLLDLCVEASRTCYVDGHEAVLCGEARGRMIVEVAPLNHSYMSIDGEFRTRARGWGVR